MTENGDIMVIALQGKPLISDGDEPKGFILPKSGKVMIDYEIS